MVEGLTHAFSPSTDGLDAEVVDVGDGNPADFARAGAAGKIALLDSLATPGKAWAAQEAGTIGQIFVNRDHLHNMIVTTIWGTPEPGTAWRIPRTPCLSVRRADGERIRKLIQEGRGRVRLVTRVRTGWSPIPHLTAHLDGTAEDRFILFSGHVDGWHYGAMDNGDRERDDARGRAAPGDAAARAPAGLPPRVLVGALPRTLRGLDVVRGPRVAGAPPALRRAPEHRLDGRPRRHRLLASSMPPRTRRASWKGWCTTSPARRRAGPPLPARGRPVVLGRSGSHRALMSLSGIPRQDTDLSRWMERLFGTAGFPWWWHTREDTIDKIDADVLALDTRVYVAAALRLVGAPLLPLDYVRFARAIAATVEELAPPPGAGGTRRRPPRPPGISPIGRRRSRGRSTPSPPAGTRILPGWRPPTAPDAPCRAS